MVVGSRIIVAAWLFLARADAWLTITEISQDTTSNVRVLPWKQSVQCVGGQWKLQWSQAPASTLYLDLNICADACYRESGCEVAQFSYTSTNVQCWMSTKKCTSLETYTAKDLDHYVMENLPVPWEDKRYCTGTMIKKLLDSQTVVTLDYAQNACYGACVADESCKYAQLTHYDWKYTCKSYGDDCKPAIHLQSGNYIATPEAYWTAQNKICDGTPFQISESVTTQTQCQSWCNKTPFCWYAVWGTRSSCALYKHDCQIIDSNGGTRVYMRTGNHIDCVGAWDRCEPYCADVTYKQVKKASNGGKDCDAEDGATKQCKAGDGDCKAPQNTPKPATPTPAPVTPAQPAPLPTPRPTPVSSGDGSSSAADIDTLAKLKAWCNESVANCAVCRGKDRDDGTCKVKENPLRKCRKFKGNAVCDRILGCHSKTNKKGKTKCKGRKHGLA